MWKTDKDNSSSRVEYTRETASRITSQKPCVLFPNVRTNGALDEASLTCNFSLFLRMMRATDSRG